MARTSRPRPSCRRASGRRKQGKEEVYHTKMWMLMKGLTGKDYRAGHKWSKKQLMAITPDKIARFIKERVYGDADAKLDEDPPIHLRTNTILMWKSLVLLHVGPGHSVFRGREGRQPDKIHAGEPHHPRHEEDGSGPAR